MIKDLVTIIIPLYNSEEYIEDCISSCQRQTYNNIEIIVIDDGSTDNSLKVASKIAKHDRRVKVIHKKNGGVSSARNKGIEQSNGEFICFLDADDCLKKDFVSTMKKYMQQFNSDYCISKNTYKNKSKTKKNIPTPISSNRAEQLLLSQEIEVGCWNKMYRKTALSDIRFREDLFYGEGLYFIIEVAHKTKKTIVFRDDLYDYRRINPKSATTSFNIEKMANGEKSLIEIYKIINNDGSGVTKMWAQHYCLFCINAMYGILKANPSDNNYKKWRRKMTKYIIPAILSNGPIALKIKIFLIFINPKMFIRTRK